MIPFCIICGLIIVSIPMMILERRGLPVVLSLHFKGDVKRETRFLAQYGQLVCTFLTALLIWQLDPNWKRIGTALWCAVIGATLFATLIKRLLGRVRPRHELAGKFLGPTWKHANYRESFPSSHSASAVAFSAVLAGVYPHAAATFWALGLICAILRYIMDAHWPSDVMCGIAIGYAAGFIVLRMVF